MKKILIDCLALSLIVAIFDHTLAVLAITSTEIENDRGIQKELVKDEPSSPSRQDTIDDGRIIRDPFTLQIVTPRNTRIFGDRLSIRWTPVEGAIHYKVVIDELDINETVQQTQFDYLESLVADGYYNIKVTAELDQENDRVDREDSVFIAVLSEDESIAVRQSVDLIEQSIESPLNKTLQLVNVYDQASLYSEAITVLEQYHEEYDLTLETNNQLQTLYKKVGFRTD